MKLSTTNYSLQTSPFWWTRSGGNTMYFLRELTGVIIAAYVIYFVIFAILDPALYFFETTHFFVMNVIAALAALLHTATWLWVTTQVTPFDLSLSVQIILFLFLLFLFFILSFFLFSFLYAKPG